MNLIKTGFLSGISTLIKIASSFIANKLIAVYIGPAGLAMIGQFQNLIQIFLTFSNGAIDRGVVKYIAEYQDNEEERKKILSNSLLISVCCAVFLSFFIILFHKYLAVTFLKDEKYGSIFMIFAVTLVLFSLNNLFLSVLNGYKEIKKFILINITSSIAALIFISVLVIKFKLYGALLALATYQTAVFFFTLFFVLNSQWFNISNFFGKIDKQSIKKLGKYSVMAITSAITLPLSQIFIRNYITGTISAEAAGFWQGVLKISDVYLLVLTTSLSVYFLPRLSEIKDKKEFQKEISNTYVIVIPISIFMALMMWLCRDIIIKVLFTAEFLPMRDLFFYQLIGDVLKICSWMLGFIMLAKAMARLYIFVEIFFSALYVFLSIFFIQWLGLSGSTISFALTYFLAFIFLLYFFRKLLFEVES